MGSCTFEMGCGEIQLVGVKNGKYINVLGNYDFFYITEFSHIV